MHRKTVFVIILLLMTVLIALGKGNYFPFDGATADGALLDVKTASFDLSGLTLTIVAQGIMVEPVELDGHRFTRFYWDNSGVSGAVGQAELPVYRTLVEIPWGAEVEAKIVFSQMEEYSLRELGSGDEVVPVQPPVEKFLGAKLQFTMDEEYYAASEYSNFGLLEVIDYPILRGHQLALLEIRPVDYNPSQGTVRIFARLEIELSFKGGDLARTMENGQRYSSSHFDRLVDRLTVNGDDFGTDELPDPPMMLVICHDNPDYLDIMQPLVDWRHSKGYHTLMVSTSVTGITTIDIQNYIIEAYFTWEIPPTFVLLVGDTPQIPNWIGQGSGSPETDLYYAAIDGGDYFADLGLGRLSPANAGELSNMVEKILEYEQVGWSGNDDWEKHATFMASNDNWQVSEGTHNYVITNFLYPEGYACDRLYCHTYNATTQQVTNSFNQGRSQGTYSGHGSTTSWGDGPPFSQNNVRALVNEVYPLIQSYSCLTGKYTIGECFGETWIRVENGAIAFWGSTVSSYWGEDDILEKGLYEGFYDNQIPGDNVNFTWINGMTDYGKMYLYQHYGPSGMIQRYFEMYNVLGDGSVDIWTDVPNAVVVDYPSVVFLGTPEVTVNVSGFPDWALVCASSTAEEDVWASGYVDYSGNVILNFASPPVQPGEMEFIITGHDIEPYYASVPLIPASGPYVIYHSLEIDDGSAWNPNGELDYTEEALLDMTLENVGTQNAIGITAVIRSEDPYITIIDSTANFGDIGAGATVSIQGAYTVALSGEVEDGHIIPFDLEAISTSGGQSWTSSFNIIAHAPLMEIVRVIVDDSLSGNGNMALDPGETADLTLYLVNSGSSPVNEVAGVLSSIDPFIVINSAMGQFGDMTPGDTASAIMNIGVDANCPQNHEADFTLDISGTPAYSTQCGFSLTVGNILYDPTGPDNYGYLAYDIHDAPILPLYEWIEIDPGLGGPGTEIPFTQDDQTFRFDLPFTFIYYGEDYDRVSICSNGWIAMGETNNTDYSNSAIPNGDGPPAMIAPFWEDLSPQSVGTVAYYYDNSEHIYVVEFSEVRQYYPDNAIETFQVILYDPVFYFTVTGDGEIKFQYKRVSDPTECTVGIENFAQNDGIQYLFNESYDIHATPIDSAMAILFTTGREAANLTLTFQHPPVIIVPAIGGYFDYTLDIVNNGTNPAIFDGWIDATLPNGLTYGPILLRNGLSLSAGASISRVLTQYVPGNAPAGLYSYNGYVGIYPDVIYSQDSFPFEKLGTDAGSSAFTGWEIFGWDDELTDNLAVPEKYSLSQNYPNPFNPVTTIEFSLPQAGKITLAVYNIHGRLVETIAEGEFTPGYFSLTWDASALSSGVYFYRLNAPGFTSVRKCLLIK